MSDVAPEIDPSWLNDRTDFQKNFVSGLLNSLGLRLSYRLEHEDDGRPLVVTDWTPEDAHVGFPGVAHGGLIAAVLDDVMGRVAVLKRRWVVTARMEVRYRDGEALAGLRRVFAIWALTRPVGGTPPGQHFTAGARPKCQPSPWGASSKPSPSWRTR